MFASFKVFQHVLCFFPSSSFVKMICKIKLFVGFISSFLQCISWRSLCAYIWFIFIAILACIHQYLFHLSCYRFKMKSIVLLACFLVVAFAAPWTEDNFVLKFKPQETQDLDQTVHDMWEDFKNVHGKNAYSAKLTSPEKVS